MGITKFGLSIYENSDPNIYEIGIDEAGKGPMFGRVYAAAVVLPKMNSTDTFVHEDLRDSKKFTSDKKLNALAKYIKEKAISWSVCYRDENAIDQFNIRQATFQAMHDSIDEAVTFLDCPTSNMKLLVDGNDFKPYMFLSRGMLKQIPHTTYEGGDNKFTAIAAASILAKTERDKYILDLCERNPELKEYYSIHTNKGYGTMKHLAGIREHGITKWHRKSYGICKEYETSLSLNRENT